MLCHNQEEQQKFEHAESASDSGVRDSIKGKIIKLNEINSDNLSPIVSFRLNKEQQQYLQKIAGRMYQKGLIKSGNIGALAKISAFYIGETYPTIEKQLVKKQRQRTKKRGWLKRLLVNGRDGDFFNVF